MSDLREAIEALRAAVGEAAGGAGEDGGDRIAEALDSGAFASSEVATAGDGTPDNVSVEIAAPVRVSDLEPWLGPVRRLPRDPGIGRPRTVLFEQTVPKEGSAGATVLAEVDDEDRVARLIVRAGPPLDERR